MSIIIKNYEDLKKHTIFLDPSEFDFIAFWNEYLEDWDMRAKVVKACTGSEGNLDFFDDTRVSKYKAPKINNPDWEEYNILCYIQNSIGENCYEWRIFKGDLNIWKLVPTGDLEDLGEILYGLDDRGHRAYIPVKVYKGIKGMVSKDTLSTFKDFMDEI